MNDELSGQLTSGKYSIPTHAQGSLWLTTEADSIPVEGPHGLFELSSPAKALTLRWQSEDGPALLALPWQVDTLEWDGRVRVGGYADALHLCPMPGDNSEYVYILYMGGHPMKYSPSSLSSTHNHLRQLDKSPDFHRQMALNLNETITSWLIPPGSPLVETVRSALVGNMRLHLFGQLATDQSPYTGYFPLPLILEAVTLFAS